MGEHGSVGVPCNPEYAAGTGRWPSLRQEGSRVTPGGAESVQPAASAAAFSLLLRELAAAGGRRPRPASSAPEPPAFASSGLEGGLLAFLPSCSASPSCLLGWFLGLPQAQTARPSNSKPFAHQPRMHPSQPRAPAACRCHPPCVSHKHLLLPARTGMFWKPVSPCGR